MPFMCPSSFKMCSLTAYRRVMVSWYALRYARIDGANQAQVTTTLRPLPIDRAVIRSINAGEKNRGIMPDLRRDTRRRAGVRVCVMVFGKVINKRGGRK